MAHNINCIKKAKLIKKIVDENYEPGRQDRNKMWIYRNVVNKIYPMHFQTFYKLLKIAEFELQSEAKEIDKRQLKLFDDL